MCPAFSLTDIPVSYVHTFSPLCSQHAPLFIHLTCFQTPFWDMTCILPFNPDFIPFFSCFLGLFLSYLPVPQFLLLNTPGSISLLSCSYLSPSTNFFPLVTIAYLLSLEVSPSAQCWNIYWWIFQSPWDYIMEDLRTNRELLAKKHNLIVSLGFPDLSDWSTPLLHNSRSPKPYIIIHLYKYQPIWAEAYSSKEFLKSMDSFIVSGVLFLFPMK